MKAIVYGAAALALSSVPAFAMDSMKMGKGMHRGEQMFGKIDANSDGSISKAESDAFASNMFTEADANRDGNLSRDEWRSHKEKEHASWSATNDGNDSRTADEGKMGSNKTGSRDGSQIGGSPAR